MAKAIFIIFIIGFLTWIYMGGDGKTVSDYKNMSGDELETLCLDKKDKTACQKIAIDFIKDTKR